MMMPMSTPLLESDPYEASARNNKMDHPESFKVRAIP